MVRGGAIRRGSGSSHGAPGWLAGRVERLFGVIKEPKTGAAYTSAKVARMSLGDLSEEDVEGIRSGSVTDPRLGHMIALARVFGVEPSYLVDGYGEVASTGNSSRPSATTRPGPSRGRVPACRVGRGRWSWA